MNALREYTNNIDFERNILVEIKEVKKGIKEIKDANRFDLLNYYYFGSLTIRSLALGAFGALNTTLVINIRENRNTIILMDKLMLRLLIGSVISLIGCFVVHSDCFRPISSKLIGIDLKSIIDTGYFEVTTICLLFGFFSMVIYDGLYITS